MWQVWQILPHPPQKRKGVAESTYPHPKIALKKHQSIIKNVKKITTQKAIDCDPRIKGVIFLTAVDSFLRSNIKI